MLVLLRFKDYNKLCELSNHYNKTKSITTATEIAKLVNEILKEDFFEEDN